MIGLAARGATGIGLARQRGGGVVPWYLSGGATGCVAAYQPKGAASLAASYSNLASPGTYDAAPGVAPTWASATGWTGNGSSMYLTTGLIPAKTWTVICRFAGGSGTGRSVVSCDLDTQIFGVMPRSGTDANRLYANGAYLLPSGVLAAGVMALAGQNAYLNGVTDGTVSGSGATPTRQLYLLADNGAGTAKYYWNGSIQAVAIYNTTLTGPQVAAISTAMAAL